MTQSLLGRDPVFRVVGKELDQEIVTSRSEVLRKDAVDVVGGLPLRKYWFVIW